jgi:hypothetical protein
MERKIRSRNGCGLSAFECRLVEIKAVCTQTNLLLRNVSQVSLLYQHVTTRWWLLTSRP